eukprot:s387_g4.t6
MQEAITKPKGQEVGRQMSRRPSPGQGQRRPDTGRRSWMVQAILPSGPMSQSTCSCARITKRGRSSSCFWSQSRAKPKRAAGWLLVPAASLAMQKVQLQSTEEGFGPLQGPVTALVVFLHGRGDTGHNMLPVVSALASAIPTARFWLPTAPLNEQGRTSWYETDSAGQFDQRIYELRRQLMVRVQVDCQQLGLQLSQVAFAGFSQGSMIAALAGLEAPSPCAGLAVLCGGVPWDLRLGDASCDVPILFVAGGCDRTVTAETTRIAKERLLELGVRKLRYTELPELAHEISSEVVEMMKEFLAGCLPCQAAQDGAALHIPEGMQVLLFGASGDSASRGVVESYEEGDDKYWIRTAPGRGRGPGAGRRGGALVQRDLVSPTLLQNEVRSNMQPEGF